MEGDGAGPASPDIIGDGDKESGEGAAGEGGEDMVLLDGPGPGLRLGLSELGEVVGAGAAIIGDCGFMVLEGDIAIGAGEGAWLEDNVTKANDMASTSMARAGAMIQKKMKVEGCRENKEERKKKRE